MSIYDDLKPVVAGLIAEFKQGVIRYIKLTPGTGPIDEPGPSTEITTALDATVRGVSFKYIQNGFAVVTDLMVTAVVIDNLTPNIRDFIEIDGERYKILHFLPIPGAGTRIIWKFIVRKGG